MNEGPAATRAGLRGQPPAAESVMVARDLELVAWTGARYHVAHISTAAAVRAVRDAKQRGLPVTAEVTPHHLTLTDVACCSYDTATKVAPPLRREADHEALREALADGTIDCIATDHAPHATQEKEVEFDQAAFGMIGLETALGLGLKLVDDKVLTLPALIRRLTIGAAQVFGLPGGTLGGARPPTSPSSTSKRAYKVDPEHLPLEVAQLAVPRLGAARAREPHHRRRRRRPRGGRPWLIRRVWCSRTARSCAAARSARACEGGGEVVFNTALTGYEEVVTDPSYRGQIVVMTAPEIGNIGWNTEDLESQKPWLSGFVVRELSPVVSNWRSQTSLGEVLAKAGVPGIEGVDTRMLTQKLRDQGAMRGLIISDDKLSDAALIDYVQKSPGLEGRDLVREVTSAAPFTWEEGSWQHAQDSAERRARDKHIVAYDFGMKRNILRLLVDVGCRVTVVPATTTAADVLALRPDGVFLSNGPGDPAAVTYAARGVPRQSTRRCRCSASASAIRSSGSRSAARPTSSSSAITAPTAR